MILYESVDVVTQLNCLHFGGFFAGNFCGISTANIWQIMLPSFFLQVLTCSLILNVLNMRQERFS